MFYLHVFHIHSHDDSVDDYRSDHIRSIATDSDHEISLWSLSRTLDGRQDTSVIWCDSANHDGHPLCLLTHTSTSTSHLSSYATMMIDRYVNIWSLQLHQSCYTQMIQLADRCDWHWSMTDTMNADRHTSMVHDLMLQVTWSHTR